MNRINRNKTASVPWPVLYLLEFSGGLSFSALGSVIPDMNGVFGTSSSVTATLPGAQFFGGSAALVLLGFILSRVKPKSMLLCAGLLMGFSSLLIALIRSYSLALVLVFFLLGTAMSTLFALPGVITTRSGGEGARRMNIVYSFMSAGVVCSPMVSGIILARGGHYPLLFLFVSAVAFSSAALAFLLPFPPIDLGGGFSPSIMKRLMHAYRGFMAVVLLMGLFYMGAEAVPNNWIPAYLSETFDITGFRPGFVLAGFWAAITAGRHLCAAVLGFWNKPRALLMILTAGGSACLLAVPFLRSSIQVEFAFIISGLFFSGMIPIIFSFYENLPPDLAGTMFLLVLTVGMIGASLMGKGIGVIADIAGFSAAILLGVPLLLAILGLTLLLPRFFRTQ